MALTAACGSDPPPDPIPQNVTQVAAGGFHSPTDAVASLDGSTFYFAAFDDAGEPALFSTASQAGSAAQPLATGAPLQLPVGLVLSCDGGTVYIADLGDEDVEDPPARVGGIYAQSTAGGAITDLGVTGLESPGGLAMGPDCETLYATARTADGAPALFSLPVGGGAATAIYTGEPMIAPTGLHVDADAVAWVMDHLAEGPDGDGVLFRIPSDGSSIEVVASALDMGTPGGVSTTQGGTTAVMPTKDADGNGQLTTIGLSGGAITQVPASMISDPAGLRVARNARVFAVVDHEGDAIYRAE
jgi:DNA-binding beta-propeller fold protein YncE